MLIPKGKMIVFDGIKYRPGQKVLPAHKRRIRELLHKFGSEPIEEEKPMRDTIPAPKKQARIIDKITGPPPPASPTNLIEEEKSVEKATEEKKERKPKRKKSKE